jgi:hypothetical protein
MKYLILGAMLFCIGCSTPQQYTREEQIWNELHPDTATTLACNQEIYLHNNQYIAK